MKFIGMDLKDAIPIAKEFGARIDLIEGNYHFVHPNVGTVRVTKTRRETPRALAVFLKQLERHVRGKAIDVIPKKDLPAVDARKVVLTAAVRTDGDVQAPKLHTLLKELPLKVDEEKGLVQAKPLDAAPAQQRERQPKPPKPPKPPKFVPVAAPVHESPGHVTGEINADAFREEMELEALTRPDPPPEPAPEETFVYRREDWEVYPKEEPLPASISASEGADDTVENETESIDMAEEPSEPQIPEEIRREVLEPVPAEPAPVSPANLTDQLKMYRQMREQLAQNGLRRLQQLQIDRKGMLDMLRDTDKEIDVLCQELSDAGVTIPVDLLPLPGERLVDTPIPAQTPPPQSELPPSEAVPVPMTSTIVPVGTTIEQRAKEMPLEEIIPRTIEEKRKLAGLRAAQTRKAKANLDKKTDWRLPAEIRIVEYMKENVGLWMTGNEIMEALGMDEKQPSKILTPLVEAGHLHKRGSHRHTQYCWLPPEEQAQAETA